VILGTDRVRSKGFALALLATAQLILALDYSIVNVALPEIGPSLGFTGARVQWVISAYALTYGGFLLLGGRAADLLGRRRVWIGALVVFGLASVAGGLAVEPVLLVASRALQGAAGAFLFPATLALVDSTFAEGPERTRAIAVWGSAGASGLALGVLAGGVLTGLFSWRAVFFVNVPIAIALVALAPTFLQGQTRSPSRRRFDLPGAFLVTAGTMAIVFALVEAPTAGWVSVIALDRAPPGLPSSSPSSSWSSDPTHRSSPYDSSGFAPFGPASSSPPPGCLRSGCSSTS
jgi:MFS family permease